MSKIRKGKKMSQILFIRNCNKNMHLYNSESVRVATSDRKISYPFLLLLPTFLLYIAVPTLIFQIEFEILKFVPKLNPLSRNLLTAAKDFI